MALHLLATAAVHLLVMAVHLFKMLWTHHVTVINFVKQNFLHSPEFSKVSDLFVSAV